MRDIGPTLGQHRRQLADVKPTVGRHILFDGYNKGIWTIHGVILEDNDKTQLFLVSLAVALTCNIFT